MRKITKIRRSIKAISPVISVLLMIAIAVVASLVVYAWIMGYIGGTTTKAGQAIQIQSYAGQNGYLTIYVQNIGQGAVNLKQDGSVYINDVLHLITNSPAGSEPLTTGQLIPINVGETVEIVTDYPYTPGEQVRIKIVTVEGTFMESTGSSGSGSSGAPVTMYDVTFTLDSPGGASMDPSPGVHSVGGAISISAVAANDYSFDQWIATGSIIIGDVNDFSTTATINGEGSIEATFTYTPGTYAVTVTASPDPEAIGGSFLVTYTKGTVVHPAELQHTPWTETVDVSTTVTVSNPGTITGYTYSSINPPLGILSSAGTVTLTYTQNQAAQPHYVDTRTVVVGSENNWANMYDTGTNTYDTLTEANVAGAGSWTTPSSVNSYCGQDSSHPATYAIDGSISTYWRHNDDSAHWIVFDMGQSVTITQVQLYQGSSSDDRWPTGDGSALVNVYVSNNPASGNWGTAVLNNWDANANNNNPAGWVTSGTFSATGRYIILQMTSSSGSEDNARMYEFQAMVTPSANYQLDYQVQFTGITSGYTQLQIATGNLGTENLQVYYRATSADSWQALSPLSLTASSVNTYTNPVSGTTLQLRFVDGTPASDTTQNSWEIDYIRLVAP